MALSCGALVLAAYVELISLTIDGLTFLESVILLASSNVVSHSQTASSPSPVVTRTAKKKAGRSSAT